MHGLINRALQRFVTDTYGEDAWEAVVDTAGLEVKNFQPMLHYDDDVTDSAISTSSKVLGKPSDALLEDLGIYLVAHPNSQVLRRLLRFGGDAYSEFLGSLDDLPERVRLAVPDLDFPLLEVDEQAEGRFKVRIGASHAGFARVLGGVLQGMADDYGALATIDSEGREDGVEHLLVHVHDMAFSEGRDFELAQPGGSAA